MPLTAIILIEPKPGKEQRCDELLSWLTKEVEANEPDVTLYYVRSSYDFKEGIKTFFVQMQ